MERKKIWKIDGEEEGKSGVRRRERRERKYSFQLRERKRLR
jgi:hypothetical protein